MATVQLQESLLHLFLVSRSYHLLGLGQILRSQLALYAHQLLYQRLVLFEQLVIAFRHRPGYNQRRTGIVDQYGVDLVHDGVIVCTLHQILGIRCHIVAQVVETELVVRSERNVGQIGTTAGVAVGLMLVDTVHTQTVEHVERPHPLGVTLGQIVIDRHHMHAVSGQGIQEHRQGCHQCFTLSGRHLGNLALVQHDTTEKLHVVVYHIPHRIVSSGRPMIVVMRRVALNVHEIELCRQLAVKIVGRHVHDFLSGKTLGRGLHDGEHHRHDFVQSLFVAFQHVFLQLVNLRKKRRTVFNRHFFHLCLQLCNFSLEVVGRRLHVLFHFLRLGTQGIITECLNFRVSFFHGLYQRLNQLHVPGRLIPEKLAQKLVYIHIFCFVFYSRDALCASLRKVNQKK